MSIVNYHSIKRQLETIRCPTCNEHPTITIKGEGFEVKCCCKDFEKTLKDKTDKLIKDSAEKTITNRMNNILKNLKNIKKL